MFFPLKLGENKHQSFFLEARGFSQMDEILQFILHHGYLVLVAWVFAEQLGLPLPSIPVLLAGGALAGTGNVDLTLVVLFPAAGTVLADVIWYEIGRHKGASVLNMICKISLEPDSCVRNTENRFARNGPNALLVAKFVPGLNTAAPPLAGMLGMRLPRFLLYDGAGSLIYNALFVVLGFVFSHQLEKIARIALGLGFGLLLLVVAGFVLYIAWKYFQRQRFLRSLRINRITPEELKEKLEAGGGLTVVDLRHSVDFESDPNTIPGAFYLPSEELDQRYEEIPQDQEIVLYCT